MAPFGSSPLNAEIPRALLYTSMLCAPLAQGRSVFPRSARLKTCAPGEYFLVVSVSILDVLLWSCVALQPACVQEYCCTIWYWPEVPQVWFVVCEIPNVGVKNLDTVLCVCNMRPPLSWSFFYGTCAINLRHG